MSERMYDLVDGGQLASSEDSVLWWSPDRNSENRVKVFSPLPPPPISPSQKVRWENHVETYEMR